MSSLMAYSVKFDLSWKELIFGGVINRGYLFWLISQIQLNPESVGLAPPDNPNTTEVTSPDAKLSNLTVTAAVTDSSTESPVTSAASSEETSAARSKL